MITAAAVSAAVLTLYLWTRSHSIAGLFPPDLAPPRLPDEGQIVEYVRRALAWPPVPLLAPIAAAATVGLAYLTARAVAATRATALVAALALGVGRSFWEQALLPGAPMFFALGAALAISSALALERTRRHAWAAAALVLFAAVSGVAGARSGGGGFLAPARWVFVEMNAAGIALALLGIASLLRTRVARGSILLAGALVLTLTAPLRGPSSHAALIPLYIATTPLVAAGATALLDWLQSRWVTAALLVLLPAVPLAGNFRHATAESDTVSRWHLDAVVDVAGTCPDAIQYAGGSAVPAAPLVAEKSAPGCQPLVLPEARVVYEHLGARFVSLNQPGPMLDIYEGMLPGGTVAALAIPASLRQAPNAIAARVTIIASERGDVQATGENARATLARGTLAGTFPVVTVVARSDPSSAAIRLDDQDILTTRNAAAYAAIAPDGRPLIVAPLQGLPWRVPFDRERFGLSRMAGDSPCAELRPGEWADVSGLASEGRLGVVDNTGSGRVVMYAARERPLEPWLVRTWGGTAPELSIRVLDSGSRQASLEQDGLDVRRLAGSDSLVRIELRSPGARATLTSLDFGGIPAHLLGRADPGVRVCSAPRGEGFFATDDVDAEHINGRRSFFGDGWGPAGRMEGRDWRPLVKPEGELLVSIAHTHALRVVVTASAGASGEIALGINDRPLAPQRATAGAADYTWTVPADWWRTGVNQVFVSGAPGLKIADVQFVRADR